MAVPRLTVGGGELDLGVDEAGELRLLRAVASRAPPSGESEPSSFRLVLARIDVQSLRRLFALLLMALAATMLWRVFG